MSSLIKVIIILGLWKLALWAGNKKEYVKIEMSNIGCQDLVSLYEKEILKYTTPLQAQIIAKRSEEIATKVNTSVSCIYEVAYLECGLNPFNVRSDLVAAGWIQFTRRGLKTLLLQC